jgi:protein TonB
MRRRRKKNTLLTRIIVVSVAVHAIALPIAAHFGAFDKIRHEFGSSRVVMVTVPPIEEKKQATKKEKKPKKASPTTKKGPTTRRASHGSSKPNPLQPKVVAASGTGADEGSEPTVNPNGTGAAGLPPTGPPGAGSATTQTPPPVVNSKPPPTPTVTEPPPTQVAAVTPKPAAPVEKKFVQVETTYAPEPTIPDDLRAQPLDKTLVVEADVNANGEPENVRIAESTGIQELDGIGLDTAKHYKFKPATLADEPVMGHVRFRIIFKVE